MSPGSFAQPAHAAHLRRGQIAHPHAPRDVALLELERPPRIAERRTVNPWGYVACVTLPCRVISHAGAALGRRLFTAC